MNEIVSRRYRAWYALCIVAATTSVVLILVREMWWWAFAALIVAGIGAEGIRRTYPNPEE